MNITFNGNHIERENAKAIFKWPVLCFRFICFEKVISCQDSAIIRGFETDI